MPKITPQALERINAARAVSGLHALTMDDMRQIARKNGYREDIRSKHVRKFAQR